MVLQQRHFTRNLFWGPPKDPFNENSHLAFFDKTILILIKFLKEFIKILIVKILRPQGDDEVFDFTEESSALFFVEVPVFIGVFFNPGFVEINAKVRCIASK